MVGHPYGLMRALEKLGAYNKRIPMNISPSTSALCIVAPLNGGQMMMSLFSTHPPLDRQNRSSEEHANHPLITTIAKFISLIACG